jgi:hypothetical protein
VFEQTVDNMKSRIILAGGSGFLGQALAAALLERGYEVTVLTRGETSERAGVQHLHWDGKTLGDWGQAIDGAHGVVNLTGRSIDCRHTPDNRREIIASRVNSVRVLGEAVAASVTPPQVFVQSSAIGYYGDTADRISDENAPRGDDFIAEVCRDWEGAFEALDLPRTRRVVLRIGVVLGREGGALKLLGKLTRLFLGSAVGSGRQFISWIHLTDVTRMFVAAIEQPELSGIFNATAPEPVTNRAFMAELRRTLHRPWSPPVPASITRATAWLMGSEGDLALLSSRCLPRRFLDHGFTFEFPTLAPALQDLYETHR